MATRIITAAFLIAAVLLWLFVAQFPIFTIGALFIYMVSAYELGPILGYKSKIPFVLIALAVMTFFFYMFPPGLYMAYGVPLPIKFIICLAIPFWIVVTPLVRMYPIFSGWLKNRLLGSIAGLFMLVPFFFGLLFLRSLDYAESFYTGAVAVVSVMVLVWACDSGAYFAGRAMGKTPLIVNVSPNKTREGLYGGLILALVCFAALDYLGAYEGVSGNQLLLIVAAVACILFSVVGDLVESMFKRKAGVKDSGTIFPGHGGMLDRVDSQLAAIPVFCGVCILGSGQVPL